MAALTTQQEYDAVREAIQLLTSLDSTGARRDIVSFNIGDMSVSYSSAQLNDLRSREVELARRLTIRNSRKRTTASFSGGATDGYLYL
jgi:hypothetical protein